VLDADWSCAIINTGSKQGITLPICETAYDVSKAGLNAFTEDSPTTSSIPEGKSPNYVPPVPRAATRSETSIGSTTFRRIAPFKRAA
jgi:hypothetical protein